LDAVAARQQLAPIDLQFLGQVLGGHALGNAPQDLDDGGAAIAGLGPEGAGEEIEHRATGAAAVVEDRGTLAIMRGLVVRQAVPVRTVQPVRMQDLEQKGVAGLVIEQIIERKLQHRTPSLVLDFTHDAAEPVPSLHYTSNPT
jgi:hypothetical protein